MSVTIPVHTGCDIGRGLAMRILKDGGFSVEETAKMLNVSVRTVMNDWKFAKAWLLREMQRR